MTMRPLTFVWLSTTDWDAPQFGSRQQLARRLAGRGHRVLFVEVARSLHSFISDAAGTRRAMGRMGRIRREEKKGNSGELEGTQGKLGREDVSLVEYGSLYLYTPRPVLPVYYHPVTNYLNQRLMAGDLRGVVRRLGWRPDVLWTYWPNTADLIGRLGERLAVYHCIDDFTAVTYPLTPAGAIAKMEAALCQRVDMVFTRTEGLAAQKKRLNPQTFAGWGGYGAI
jgi:hypothetical protein